MEGVGWVWGYSIFSQNDLNNFWSRLSLSLSLSLLERKGENDDDTFLLGRVACVLVALQ